MWCLGGSLSWLQASVDSPVPCHAREKLKKEIMLFIRVSEDPWSQKGLGYLSFCATWNSRSSPTYRTLLTCFCIRLKRRCEGPNDCVTVLIESPSRSDLIAQAWASGNMMNGEAKPISHHITPGFKHLPNLEIHSFLSTVAMLFIYELSRHKGNTYYVPGVVPGNSIEMAAALRKLTPMN